MKYILNCAIFPDFDSATSKNGEKNDKFAKKIVNLSRFMKTQQI